MQPDLPCNLLNIGWLSQQPGDFRDRMIDLGKWSRFDKGQVLYGIADEPEGVLGLEEGLLDIAIPISNEEMVTLHRAAPGFWIGDSALLAETTRGVEVSAAADCRILTLPVQKVRRDLAEYPQDWNCFFRLSHMNVMLTIKALAEIIALPPAARIARALLRQADNHGVVRNTQEDLGRMIGMSRATYKRAFAMLVEAGLVRQTYGGLQISDRMGLQKAAEALSVPE